MYPPSTASGSTFPRARRSLLSVNPCSFSERRLVPSSWVLWQISYVNYCPERKKSLLTYLQGGRKWIYVVSIFFYAVLNIGTARAINLPMLIIFMFLTGFAGSTALSNVAGTIADLFGDRDVAGQAMALFVCSANIGPSVSIAEAHPHGHQTDSISDWKSCWRLDY